MSKRCLDCPAIALPRQSRCSTHQRQYEQRRGPSGWARQKANAATIAAAGTRCAMAANGGCYGALEVDHVARLEWTNDDSEPNRQVLCHRHHSQKTAREARR